jgi:hypothetical protein
MKTSFALIVLCCSFSTFTALAATTVNVAPRKLAIAGDGLRPAQFDFSAELKKTNIGVTNETARLISVDLKIKAQYTGATIALLVAGVAVDSFTVEDDQVVSFSLKSDSTMTTHPWAIAVRGTAQILEMQVTVDAANGADQPVLPTTPTQPVQPQPTPAPTPTPLADLQVGQVVIAVSRTSGRIEPVQITSIEADGTYSVQFDGQIYPNWSRDQLATVSGCSKEFCIGTAVQWSGWSKTNDLRIIGLLVGDRLVLESRSADERMVAAITEVKKPTFVTPKPQPSPKNRLRFSVGQLAYYVQENHRVNPARVLSVDEKSIIFKVEETGEEYRSGIRSARMAQTTGCTSTNFCVGQQATTLDRGGKPRSVTIVGLQSEDFAVVQIDGSGIMVGNWPIEALRR